MYMHVLLKCLPLLFLSWHGSVGKNSNVLYCQIVQFRQFDSRLHWHVWTNFTHISLYLSQMFSTRLTDLLPPGIIEVVSLFLPHYQITHNSHFGLIQIYMNHLLGFSLSVVHWATGSAEFCDERRLPESLSTFNGWLAKSTSSYVYLTANYSHIVYA